MILLESHGNSRERIVVVWNAAMLPKNSEFFAFSNYFRLQLMEFKQIPDDCGIAPGSSIVFIYASLQDKRLP